MHKIALINYDMSTRGGSQQVLANLVNAMDQEYEIHVISLIRENERWAYEFANGVACKTILQYKARIRETLRKGKKELNQYLSNQKIELVFYVGAYAGLCASIMARKQRCKKVFCDHGALMNQWNELPARLMRTMGSRLSDKTVVLTKQSEQAYYDKFHYPKGRVITIYNWMDEKILQDVDGYNLASKRIITAGRFSHEKGYDLLVKTAAALQQICSDWEWDVYGDGDLFEEIRQQLETAGLSERVHLCGLTNQMSKCYQGHALYVLTSYREGLPLVLIEAKANHLPIVSFDIISGPAEIVTDGEDGILIPPYDTVQMAEAIAELLQNSSKREHMANQSKNRIECFSKEKILEQWHALIGELLSHQM